jgi:hypothetical protein
MMSKTNDPANYEAVINIVRSWPATQRFMLVQEVLATLAPEKSTTARREPTLSRARGLLATQQSPPTDADIEALLDTRRQERYGS